VRTCPPSAPTDRIATLREAIRPLRYGFYPEEVADVAVTVTVVAGTGRFDPADDRWQAQVRDLYADLDRASVGFRRDTTVVPRTKGVVETAVLALASTGAFNAAARCWQAWLARDRSRHVELVWTQDGRERRLTIDADNADAVALRHLIDGATGKGEDARWPTGTEPS
jgi:hypothetical protein